MDNGVHSITKNLDPEDQQHSTEQDLFIVCSSPKLPEPETHDNKPQQRKWYRCDKRFFVELLTLAAIVCAGFVYWGQLREMMNANTLAMVNAKISDQATAASLRLTREGLELTRQSNDALKKQVGVMEQGLDTTERAWVLPSLTGPRLTPEGDSVLWDVEVLLRNTGKTPAFVEFAADSSLEPKPPEVRGYESGIVIAPGEAENPALPHIIRLSHPTKAELPDVAGGSRTLYVWILVRYKDPIRDDRFTQFCSIYYPRYGRFGPCPSRYQIFR